MQRIGVLNPGFNAIRSKMANQSVAFAGANHEHLMNRFTIEEDQLDRCVLTQVVFVKESNPPPVLRPIMQIRKKATQVTGLDFIQARI
jgi:hypothetical protein